jgi:hypothetical protein
VFVQFFVFFYIFNIATTAGFPLLYIFQKISGKYYSIPRNTDVPFFSFLVGFQTSEPNVSD